MPGPLEGLRAVEMVGLGPGPFCGMLLADMGAELLRVDRVDAARAVDHSKPATSAMDRGKQAVAIDLKQPDGVEALLRLMEQADAFFEVFRPGAVDRPRRIDPVDPQHLGAHVGEQHPAERPGPEPDHLHGS